MTPYTRFSKYLQLRIFAAGVLNNAALAGVSLFCMYIALPLLLETVYAKGLGAVVVDVHPVCTRCFLDSKHKDYVKKEYICVLRTII